MKVKLQSQNDLAKLITKLDEKDDNEGSQLSFTHATTIGWRVIQEYRKGASRKELKSRVINRLPILYKSTTDGNERKSKFTYQQIDRTMDVLDEMLKNYWWPFSSIRRSLKRIANANKGKKV